MSILAHSLPHYLSFIEQTRLNITYKRHLCQLMYEVTSKKRWDCRNHNVSDKKKRSITVQIARFVFLFTLLLHAIPTRMFCYEITNYSWNVCNVVSPGPAWPDDPMRVVSRVVHEVVDQVERRYLSSWKWKLTAGTNHRRSNRSNPVRRRSRQAISGFFLSE